MALACAQPIEQASEQSSKALMIFELKQTLISELPSSPFLSATGAFGKPGLSFRQGFARNLLDEIGDKASRQSAPQHSRKPAAEIRHDGALSASQRCHTDPRDRLRRQHSAIHHAAEACNFKEFALRWAGAKRRHFKAKAHHFLRETQREKAVKSLVAA